MTSKIFLAIGFILLVAYVRPVVMPEWGKPSPTLVIYGFSILEEAVTAGVIPAFQAAWKKKTGQEVRFFTSFAGSGTVMNQIRFGAPADIAIFSHTLDAYRLQEAGLIKTDWSTFPYHGIINRTPIVLIVRAGNPKGITGFQDLRKPDVGIVHPDPQTSGGALWAILAEYGAFAPTGVEEEAYEGLRDLWKNVIVLGSSSRASRTQFETGFGDVLITYEQEGVKDLTRGKFKHQIVLPERTIFTEHPVVIIDRNVTVDKALLIHAFLDFLWTEEAQKIFVKYGFRSITDPTLDRENRFFGTVSSPFTVGDLGGWKKANADVVEALWKKRVLEEIHR